MTSNPNTAQPIRFPSPTDRLAVELGVMDAMVDIHRATDADSMRAAFRAARVAMAPALDALDREAAHYNTCGGQVWPIVAPKEELTEDAFVKDVPHEASCRCWNCDPPLGDSDPDEI